MSDQSESARRGAAAPSRSDRFHREAPAGVDRAADPAAYGPPGPRDERATVRVASGINALAGIWLIIAPFVLGYSDGDPHWNDIVFGAIVLVLALARVAGAHRAAWMSWLSMLIGAWIFISAFWLDDTATAGVNDIILGAVVVCLALISASASDEAARGTARRIPRW